MLAAIMIQTRETDFPTSAATGRLMILNIGRIGDTILRNSILDSAFRTFAEVDYICGRHNVELLRSDKRLNRVTVFLQFAQGICRFAARGVAPALRWVH